MPSLKNFTGRVRDLVTNKFFLIGIIGLGVILLVSGVILLNRNSATITDGLAKNTASTSKKHSSDDPVIKLEIDSPDNNATVSTATVDIVGQAPEGSNVDINGVKATLNGTSFHATVPLSPGKNELIVQVIDKAGKSTQQSITVTRKDTQAATPTITLNVKLSGGDAQLSWASVSLPADSSYYILSSASSTLAYPADKIAKTGTAASTYTNFNIIDGQTHYYQICQVTSSSDCGTLSNVVSIVGQTSSTVGSINITGTSGSTVNFTSSDQPTGGFYLLWSLSPSPSYPGSASKTLLSSTAASGSITGLTSGQTYNVRICENIGGACGTYSNQVTLVAP